MSKRAAAPALDRATAYAQDVVSGRIITGDLVRRACQRHLQDLETGHERGLVWNVEAVEWWIRWYGLLPHIRGEWAADPAAGIDLEGWQAFVVGSIFGWKHIATGLRRFRWVYFEVARKNGKTAIAAPIGLGLAFFDQEPGAEVVAAATNKSQAKLVWDAARSQVDRRAALRRKIRVKGESLVMGASTFTPLAAKASSLDGLNVHGAIVDELHAHVDGGLVDVLASATGARRQPLTLYLTTAGNHESAVCWEKHEYSRRVLQGEVQDDTWFAYVAALDPGDAWTDEAVWIKANPNLGVSVKLETLRADCARAQQSPSEEAEFRRKHCNEWLDHSGAADHLAKYEEDPVGFAEEALGVRLWAKQKEILAALAKPRARVAVKSCHGSGKTFTGSIVVPWFLATPNSIVISTAPTKRQVHNLLWKQVRDRRANAVLELPGRMPPKDDHWEVNDTWFAIGFSTDAPENFQGFHGKRILVLIDEASGVDPAMMEALEGILSAGDARLLMIGNPTKAEGFFYKAFTANRATFDAFTISAFDTPNFTGEGDGAFADLVSQEWVAEKGWEWGEDSDPYRVRVLGEFPVGSEDAIIPLAWVEAARNAELEPTGPLHLGVDVARFGDDVSAIYGRRGPVVTHAKALYNRDTVHVAGEAVRLALAWREELLAEDPSFAADPVCIKVDDGGVGGGVVDQINAAIIAQDLEGLIRLTPVNAGSTAYEPERYPNRRSELWFVTADRFKEKRVDLSRLAQAEYDALTGDLTGPRYTMDGSGRRVAEKKEKTKKRLKHSPDRGDGLNLAFAPDDPPPVEEEQDPEPAIQPRWGLTRRS